MVTVGPGPANTGEVSRQEMLLKAGLFSAKVSFGAWLDGWTVSRQEKESWGKGVCRGGQRKSGEARGSGCVLISEETEG